MLQIKKIQAIIENNERAREEDAVKRFKANVEAFYDSVVAKARFPNTKVQRAQSAGVDRVSFTDDKKEVKMMKENIARLLTNLDGASSFFDADRNTELRAAIGSIEAVYVKPTTQSTFFAHAEEKVPEEKVNTEYVAVDLIQLGKLQTLVQRQNAGGILNSLSNYLEAFKDHIVSFTRFSQEGIERKQSDDGSVDRVIFHNPDKIISLRNTIGNISKKVPATLEPVVKREIEEAIAKLETKIEAPQQHATVSNSVSIRPRGGGEP